MKRYISLAEAKKIIFNINKVLNSPLVLVGGLAVNQYVSIRDSEDIDLICDTEKEMEIIRKVFPSKDWIYEEVNNDEYALRFILHIN